MLKVEKVMVVGAGQMGAGIAQVCAQSNYQVILYDIERTAVEKGEQTIEKMLQRSVEKERMDESTYKAALSRLHVTTDMNEAKTADVVVEAAVENLEVKKDIFRQLDNIAPKHTILATNTSSLPITALAQVTNRPEKVIGMHFMNPVPVMKLVEVIRALQTADSTYQTIQHMADTMNKVSVISEDFPGFIANRILMPMINEAIYTVYEGVGSIEDIDVVMKLGMNHPMGPLTLADFIGLDTCLYIMEVLYEGFGDNKYRPCPLLRQYVQAGWYGKKSGKGFYTYET